MRTSKKSLSLFLAAAILGVTAGAVTARTPSMKVVMEPAADLAGKLDKYIQAHPESAEAYYRLGRVEYLAGVMKLDQIGIVDTTGQDTSKRSELDKIGSIPLDYFAPGKPSFEPWSYWGVFVDEKQPGLVRNTTGNFWAGGIINPDMKPQAVAEHLGQAIVDLRKAVKLDADSARYRLALACALEDAARDANELPKSVAAAPADLLKEAAGEYLKAYELASPADQKATWMADAGLHTFISYDAGQGYLRLHELTPQPVGPNADHPPAPNKDKDAARLEEIKKNLDNLANLRSKQVF